MILIENSQNIKLRLGNLEVIKVYLGNDLIYTKGVKSNVNGKESI